MRLHTPTPPAPILSRLSPPRLARLYPHYPPRRPLHPSACLTMSPNAIAGGAAGGAVVLLLALLGGICWCHRRHARRKLGVAAMVPAVRHTRTPALEPFLAGMTGVGNAGVFAPPPYAKTPRKGATPPTGWFASLPARERANVSHARSSTGAGAHGGAGAGPSLHIDSDAVRPTERERGARRVRA
jgi:hypothetical protein